MKCALLFLSVIALTCAYTIQWEYANGTLPAVFNDTGYYSALYRYDPNNVPPARTASAGGIDSIPSLWLFGGSIGTGQFSDLWRWNGTWFWLSGTQDLNVAGVYGTMGTAAATNQPGGRNSAVGVPTRTGSVFYLFGGNAYDAAGVYGYANDLWRFDGQWTWLSGSKNGSTNGGVYGTMGTPAAGNTPGSRAGSAGAMDSTGNMWIFGGYGYTNATDAGFLNDLWRYTPNTNMWTWMYGAATSGSISVTGPSARQYPSISFDSMGSMYLFGGLGILGTSASNSIGYLSDLWKMNSTGWNLLKGSTTVSSNPRYGTMGLSEAANTPGGRFQLLSGVDNDGLFWVFGGAKATGSFNDLWRFTGNWTWFQGSSSLSDAGSYPTSFGTVSTLYTPPARHSMIGGFNGSQLWMAFGSGAQGYVNDLWISHVIPDPPSSSTTSSSTSSSTTSSSSSSSSASSTASSTRSASTGTQTTATQDTSSASVVGISLALALASLILL